MGRLWAKERQIAAAERGRIIQRVLVDGWSPAQTAAAFGMRERSVARWVAAYRRRGMASLRQDGNTEPTQQRWLRRLKVVWLHWFGGLPHISRTTEAAPCVVLRRTGDKGHNRR